MNRARGVALLLLGAATACAPDRGGRPEGEAAPPPDATLGVADSLYLVGAFHQARALWLEELASAQAAGDSATMADILTSLGLVARQLGDYAESRRVGEEALDLKLRLGLARELFRSYNALGLTLWIEGRLDEAVERFRQAQEAAQAVDDPLGSAKAVANMAQVHTERGDLGPAREGFGHLLDVSRSLADTVAWQRALTNLAMLDITEGNPLPAVSSLAEARTLARASGDVEAEENALGQLSTAYVLLGEPQRAFAALDTALALAERHGLRRQAAEDVMLLGDLFAAAGDHRRALDHYARAADASAELGLVEETGTLLRAQAAGFRVMGLADSARTRAERALALHREAGFRESAFADLLVLSEIAAEEGDRALALQRLNEARRVADEMGAPVARAHWALTAARVRSRLSEPDSVLAVLSAADDVLWRLGGGSRWEPEALRARAYLRLERWEAAEAAGRRAVTLVEAIRAAHGSPGLRTSVVAARADVYGDLVLVLLRQGRTPEAFEIADAARGRALLDHLAAARGDLAGGTGVAADLLRADELLRRIDDLLARLESREPGPPSDRGDAGTNATDSLHLRLQRARDDYEALASRMARVPEGALLGAVSTRVEDVRGSLDPGEVLVEYLVSPDRLHVFALSRTRLTHVALSVSADELAARVRLAIDLASRPEAAADAASVLEALHGTLIEPLEADGILRGATRLVVVPHGPLVYLPFAALTDRHGRPLVERYPVQYLGSASSLPVLRAPASRPGDRRPGAVFAPRPEELPASRAEARDVRTALRLRGSDVRVGRDATEEVFRRRLSEAGIVHLATHGVMNPFNPMFSRLDLAPGRGGGGHDDGRLEVREILALQVSADLVYLSGCETGRAGAWATDFARGEDYATLAQAFLYAGARNVVATLWRISDPAAAAFAARFYRALENHAPVDALAEAQRAMLRDPLYRAPYYWAAYQLTGSG